MKTMEQVVNKMTFEEKAEVMNNFNELNKNGCIGDCKLRQYSEMFATSRDACMDMSMFAHVVAVNLANEYIGKEQK